MSNENVTASAPVHKLVGRTFFAPVAFLVYVNVSYLSLLPHVICGGILTYQPMLYLLGVFGCVVYLYVYNPPTTTDRRADAQADMDSGGKPRPAPLAVDS